MRRMIVFLLLLASTQGLCGEATDSLLPNGEPIVGVYYYPWFSGPPYKRIALTPEFEYDNIRNPEHIHAVLKTITDYGINHAAFSYWNNSGSKRTLARTFKQNRRLFARGRKLFISPYLEPPTIDKRFGNPEADARNVDFISNYLKTFGDEPSFARLGGKPFTNIYVTFFEPHAKDWTQPGKPDFVRIQRQRIKQLRSGWKAVREGVRKRTGYDPVFTGDSRQTIVGLTEYMSAVTGLSWYTFRQTIDAPFDRPKVVSEVARHTGTTFLYTIAPGYCDRQQRWPGARIEREPFHYPYSWCAAINTLPEGVMILTHSEWYEGSVIDVTKEYGKQHYETTELYSSIFRSAYPSVRREKHRKKPIAVVYNEYTPFRINQRGKGIKDVYGIVKALQTLSLNFDVIPEKFLPEKLPGHKLLIVPSCGSGLSPSSVKTINGWLKSASEARLLYTATDDGKHAPFNRGTSLEARYGQTFLSKLKAAAAAGKSVETLSSDFLDKLSTLSPEVFAGPRPSSSFEISRGPVLNAGDTLITAAVNITPWGYLANKRPDGRGITRDHSTENTPEWAREEITFRIPLDGGAPPVSEVTAVDSDAGRFRPVEFEVQTSSRGGAKARTLVFEDKLKFHAIYAAVLSPVQLKTPQIEIHPGETIDVPIKISINSSGRTPGASNSPVNGTIRLKQTPGLAMRDTPFAVNGGSAVVNARFTAKPDYATGNRTIALEVETGERKALFWRPLRCTPGPMLALRTTRVMGFADATVEQHFALMNIGKSQATDIRVSLGDASAKLDKLPPGEQATVNLTCSMPAIPADGPSPRKVRVTKAEVQLTCNSFGRRVNQTLPVKMISVRRAPKRRDQAVVYVVNPYDFGSGQGTGVKAVPIKLGKRDLSPLTWRRLFVANASGQNIPSRRLLGKLYFSAPCRETVTRFTVSSIPRSESKSDLRVIDFSGDEEGFVTIENEYLSLTFDEARGGMLMSIVDRKTGVDYAAHPAGACVVQYPTPEGDTTLSSRMTGEINITKTRNDQVTLKCTAEDSDIRVTDEWTVRSHDPAAHLERKITVMRSLSVSDFVPLNLRLSSEYVDSILPCGVGFEENGSKFGTLDTWHISDGYFAYKGDHARSSNSVGLALTDPSAVRRVSYGFFGDETHIRLRGYTPLAYSQTIEIEADVFAGPNLHYEYAHERALLQQTTPLVWLPSQPGPLPAEQTVPPKAPTYMREVRKPYW